MAKYVVTGAVVQVRGSASDGTPAVLYAYRGAVVDLDAKQAEHLTSVGLVDKVADVDNDPVVNPASGPTPPPAPLVPSKDAGKPEWEAHAIRSGLSESDAKVASKEDLVAIFADGGIQPEPEPEPEPEPVKAPAKATPAKAAPAKATPSKP